jgi:hypothetical protein
MFILNEILLAVISLILYAEMGHYNCNEAGIGSIEVTTSRETLCEKSCVLKKKWLKNHFIWLYNDTPYY